MAWSLPLYCFFDKKFCSVLSQSFQVNYKTGTRKPNAWGNPVTDQYIIQEWVGRWAKGEGGWRGGGGGGT